MQENPYRSPDTLDPPTAAVIKRRRRSLRGVSSSLLIAYGAMLLVTGCCVLLLLMTILRQINIDPDSRPVFYIAVTAYFGVGLGCLWGGLKLRRDS